LRKQSTMSAMEWFAWGWITIFLLLSISTHGIFQGLGLHSSNVIFVYERPILYVLLLSLAVVIWIGIHAFQKNFVLERRMIYALGSFVLCFVYIISSFNAQTTFLSKYGIWTSLLVSLFFVAGTWLTQYEKFLDLFPKIYLFFGYLIVIYGFLNLLGNAYLLDSLAFYEGIRITSIFQYANAYAVLLLTLWIVIIIEINRTRNVKAKLLHGFMLIPVCVSFLLTLSRGALVVLPIIAIVTLAMFKFKQQLMIMLYSILGLGLSLMIYTHLERAGTEVYERIQQARASQTPFETQSIFSSSSFDSWAYLFGLSMIMALLVFVITKYVEPSITRWSESIRSKWADKIVPFFLIVLFVVGAVSITNKSVTSLFPEVIRNRVENINLQTHSVYERLTMYKDAIKIWENSPIIGNGAGAWEALYERHQSYSYLSSQTHGYLQQLLIEVGLIGIIVYVGFIAMVVFSYIRFYRSAEEKDRNRYIFYFIVPITILIHSLIDFEMSYLFYSILVYLCLGIMAGTQRRPLKLNLNKSNLKKMKYGVSAVIIALLLVILIPTSRQLYALDKFKEVQNDLMNNILFDRIQNKLEQGLAQSPKHPMILLQASALNYQVFSQTQDSKYLDRASEYAAVLNKYEPNYREMVELNHSIAMSRGDKDQAIIQLHEALDRYPYDEGIYNLLITVLEGQWTQFATSGSDEGQQVAEQILDVYHKMLSRERTIEELPETINLLNEFSVSERVRLSAGKVWFMQGKYLEATEDLQKGISDDLSIVENQQIARYYLAALRKQGKDDIELYNKLVTANAAEAQEIEKLLSQ